MTLLLDVSLRGLSLVWAKQVTITTTNTYILGHAEQCGLRDPTNEDIDNEISNELDTDAVYIDTVSPTRNGMLHWLWTKSM